MEKLRELFHAVSNNLNSISLIAGSVKEVLKDIKGKDEKEKQTISNTLSSLERIENNVMSASGKLDELRDSVRPKE